MKKFIRIGIPLLLVSIGAACWFFYGNLRTTAQWQPVKQGPIISAIYGLGTVTSNKVYHLKVAIPTHVKKLYVHEGDQVKLGQPLALLNGLPLFRAGFAGTITSLPLNEDEIVYPNTEVLTLMDLRDCYILVSLEQESAIKIHQGQKVKLTFSGLINQTFEGSVGAVYPKAQESYVKILVPKLPPSILPHMTSDTAIVLEEKLNAIIIPFSSIQHSIVTLKRNGKILKAPIEIGTTNDDVAEVTSKNIDLTDLILVKA